MEFMKKIQEKWQEMKKDIEMRCQLHVSPFVSGEQEIVTEEQKEEIYRKIDELQAVVEEMEQKEAEERKRKEEKEREKAEKKARKMAAKMAKKTNMFHF